MICYLDSSLGCGAEDVMGPLYPITSIALLADAVILIRVWNVLLGM
jgi:hypothetical protein